LTNVFVPGSHVRVRRRLSLGGIRVPYWHHGIVVGDGDVVEFGGGDRWHKGLTRVQRVSLECFRRGKEAEAVTHPITWSGLTYSSLLPPEEVVDRALWLLDNQPPSYRLGYRNCESIAIWCATGDFESFQVKRFMRGRMLVTPITFVLLRKKPRLGTIAAAVGVATSLFTAVPYMHSRAFYDHTRSYPGLGSWPKSRLSS
jgi:hypothetical protein